MTNVNEVLEAVEVETVEEAAPKKRTRKPAVVKTVTAIEIIAEVTELTKQVEDLENAIRTIDSSNIIYQLAEKELNGKRKELADAYDTVYKI
jgi:exonuclease VII small subunit